MLTCDELATFTGLNDDSIRQTYAQCDNAFTLLRLFLSFFFSLLSSLLHQTLAHTAEVLEQCITQSSAEPADVRPLKRQRSEPLSDSAATSTSHSTSLSSSLLNLGANSALTPATARTIPSAAGPAERVTIVSRCGRVHPSDILSVYPSFKLHGQVATCKLEVSWAYDLGKW